MKLSLAVGLLAIAFSSFAQQDIDSQIQLRVSVLYKKIVEQGQHYSLSVADKEILLENIKNSVKLLNLQPSGTPTPGQQQQPPNQGQTQQPPQQPYPIPNRGPVNNVQVFADDACSAYSLITPITSFDSCSMLSNVYRGRNVWSVKVNEMCVNTADRSFIDSCGPLQLLSQQPVITNPVVELFGDDACQSRLINLDPQVDYNAWSPVLLGKNIWSLRVESKCININDVPFSAQRANNYINSALAMRTRYASGETIELYADDACGASSRITNVQRGDNCSQLSDFYSVYNVWSIRFRGRCENISDLNFASACELYTR